MPREQLQALTADVERLLVAGGALAAGDEGLRRRAGTLRELGQKLPVLTQIADAVQKVTDTSTSRATPALLDLLLVVRQVRAGLASVGLEGPLEDLPPSGPWTSGTAAHDLYPLVEACRGSGGQRVNVLEDALKREVVADIRLLSPFLDALKDSSHEFADLVAEEALPAFVKSVLAELPGDIQMDGNAPDARKLMALCRIDPKMGDALCLKALESTTPAMWKAAIRIVWKQPAKQRYQRLAPFCERLSESGKGDRAAGEYILKLFEKEAEAEKPRGGWDARWAKLLLSHLDGRNRVGVAIALGVVMGPNAVPHLLEVLAASVKAGECGVVETLGRLGAREAIGPMIELMPGQQEYHYCVHDALRRIGDPAAIPLLQALLAKTRGNYRKNRISAVIDELEAGKKAKS
jgi:hypothetical protein